LVAVAAPVATMDLAHQVVQAAVMGEAVMAADMPALPDKVNRVVLTQLEAWVVVVVAHLKAKLKLAAVILVALA
jgi:hypothetical protein